MTAIPNDANPRDRGGPAQPLLIVEGLKKHFPIRGGLLGRAQAWVQAVDGVDFVVGKGETLGIVGESGCGKSTTARLLMHLMTPDSGDIIFDGDAVGTLRGLSVRDLRRQMQMVFQDSYSSLNPRMTIEDSIAFGLVAQGTSAKEARTRAASMLRMVGLTPDMFSQRYPHELSGGQRQRVNIARALTMSPRLLILDEAVSALDKSVEAQVLNLLQELKRKLELTYIFISHDLNVIQYISDRVLVMYLGKAVEIGPVDEIYRAPKHPYTRALLSSRPSMDPRQRMHAPPLSGDPPNPINPPSGCRFRTRCPIAEQVCSDNVPLLGSVEGGEAHPVACHAHRPGSGHSAAPTEGVVH
ncbi:ABC transporter ATP-binding protein [Bosea sp. SSUT16]|uniref:Glutathione import ATP-binding protein GsiA n=1 Tax=Bosea spartocytisi TaxID=2773451 RepID=A0A927E5D4_9HYPH|nr:ABC transporter ATP-binding protein [Bosea spartocytisi]MBD3844487.1 ABC transporter ATP-binding protein [Bosea spartocytisi]MCT4470406.1 ABC transporter ATP-binding protein [Bosea spartocytisi]